MAQKLSTKNYSQGQNIILFYKIFIWRNLAPLEVVKMRLQKGVTFCVGNKNKKVCYITVSWSKATTVSIFKCFYSMKKYLLDYRFEKGVKYH